MEELYFYPSLTFIKGLFKNTPVLYSDTYRYFRNPKDLWIFSQFNLHVYSLRHADEGDWIIPVTIDNPPVNVNYCGFIVSHVDLFETYKELLVKSYADVFIPLTEKEGYELIGDHDGPYEELDFLQYLKELK